MPKCTTALRHEAATLRGRLMVKDVKTDWFPIPASDGSTAYSAATRLPIAALTAGITFSAISSIERRDSAGSVQSLPQ
jgi:hypothetical protein